MSYTFVLPMFANPSDSMKRTLMILKTLSNYPKDRKAEFYLNKQCLIQNDDFEK